MLPLVTVDGRLGADVALRFSTAGTAVANLRVVASSRKKNDAGEWEDDRVLWIDCTAFGQLAENCAESLEKGDLVVVVGRLQTDEWTDRESGEKRSKIALIADTVAPSIKFRQIPHGAGRAERASSGSGQRSSRPPADDPWATGAEGFTSGGRAGYDDDPPFLP